MKKSLIALAVIGAFAAPAAMAEVTIYGSANVSFDAVSTGSGTSTATNAAVAGRPAAGVAVSSASANSLSSNASLFGLKGKEDLGDGLSAIWQIEEAINFVNSGTNTAGNGNLNTPAAFAGNSNFQSRDTFVGLSSSTMGTLIAGIHDTPYKMATRGADVFADTIADNRSIMGGAGLHDARLNNVVAFIAPAINGFTIAVALAADAENPAVSATKGSASSMAVLYGNGPWNADFAFQNVTFGSVGSGSLAAAGTAPAALVSGTVMNIANSDKTSAWKIGGGYTVDQFQINAVYEKLAYKTAATAGSDVLSQGNWYLSGKYHVTASDALKLAYTRGGQRINTTNTTANQVSLGYDHDLSKHTAVYALYSRINNSTGAAYGLGSNDSNSNYNSSTAGLLAGNSPSVFSLGMKHAF